MQPVTASEVMVTAASRQLHNGEVVVVGLGLPQVACVLAKKTHAPDLTMILEIGVTNMEPIDTPVGLADSRIFYRATCWSGFLDTLGMSLHRGMVDVGFLGALEVDRYGSINTTLIKDREGRVRYFNGSAGGNDVASHAKRVMIVSRHGKHKFPPLLAHLTSPGFVNGKSRQELALRGGGPHRIITDMAIIGFDSVSHEATLLSVHPGVKVQDVIDNTGFPLHLPEAVPITEVPTAEEVRLLREEIDPKRVYLKEGESSPAPMAAGAPRP
jgi:glutaconate CoA-transferase subunit B